MISRDLIAINLAIATTDWPDAFASGEGLASESLAAEECLSDFLDSPLTGDGDRLVS